MGETFWQKDSLITHILFELRLIMILSPVANFGQHPLYTYFCYITFQIFESTTLCWPKCVCCALLRPIGIHNSPQELYPMTQDTIYNRYNVHNVSKDFFCFLPRDYYTFYQSRQALTKKPRNHPVFIQTSPYKLTVAINELSCLKNAGAQISLFFTSYE